MEEMGVKPCGTKKTIKRRHTTITLVMNRWRSGLTLQNVKADTAKLVNVGVVDLGQEAHLGGCHWIFLGQEEFKFEDTAY